MELCWDPHRVGQVSALNRVQARAAKFANNTDQIGWEALSGRRLVSRLCAPFKAYLGNRAWKAIYRTILGREDHNRKIRSRKQRTDIGKFSFVNRTIISWNQLPADLLASFPFKLNKFRKIVKKLIAANRVKS
jgi:hypothetical protein